MKHSALIAGSLFIAVVGGAGLIARFMAPLEAVETPAPTVALKVKPRIYPRTAETSPPLKPLPPVRNEEFPSPVSRSHESDSGPPSNMGLVPNSLPVSEQELQDRAAQVEQEANHDLKHLIGLLDLTDTQQDRIFESLVRHAPGWHPSMQTLGVATPVEATPNLPDALAPAPGAPGTGNESALRSRSELLDDIAATLTPDQQFEWANAELDRREWWEEIIPKLLPMEETPGITGGTQAGTAVAASPPSADEKDEPAVLAE